MLSVPKINAIFFKQTQNVPESTKNPIALPKQDSFVSENSVEPPVLEIWKVACGIFTDEQIAQINKAKKLPPNAKFHIIYEPDPKYARSMGGYRINTGKYMILPNILSKGGRYDLPESYEVKRDEVGRVQAMKKETAKAPASKN